MLWRLSSVGRGLRFLFVCCWYRWDDCAEWLLHCVAMTDEGCMSVGNISVGL